MTVLCASRRPLRRLRRVSAASAAPSALQRDAERRQRHGPGAVGDAADRRAPGMVRGEQRDAPPRRRAGGHDGDEAAAHVEDLVGLRRRRSPPSSQSHAQIAGHRQRRVDLEADARRSGA